MVESARLLFAIHGERGVDGVRVRVWFVKTRAAGGTDVIGDTMRFCVGSNVGVRHRVGNPAGSWTPRQDFCSLGVVLGILHWSA